MLLRDVAVGASRIAADGGDGRDGVGRESVALSLRHAEHTDLATLVEERFSATLVHGRACAIISPTQALTMASSELQLVLELCRHSRRRARPTVNQLERLADLRSEYRS